ncbi:MAG: IS3 family transposase [Aggregatibacter sp.]
MLHVSSGIPEDRKLKLKGLSPIQYRKQSFK